MTKFKEVQHYQALIDDLIARGKEKGFLTHEEVLHALPGDHGPEQYEEILSTLEERKILVVDNEKDAMKKLSRPSMDEDSEKDSLDISDDDDAADYSSRSTDPVRMYLREMGAVPLLDRDGEVVIAKKIEQGEMDVLYALVEVPVAVEELINVGEDLRQNRIKLKDVVKTIEEDDPSEDEMNQRTRVILLLDEIKAVYRKKRKIYKKLDDCNTLDRKVTAIQKDIFSCLLAIAPLGPVRQGAPHKDHRCRSSKVLTAQRLCQFCLIIFFILPQLKFVFFRQVVIDSLFQALYLADKQVGFKRMSGPCGRYVPESYRVFVSCHMPDSLGHPQKIGKLQ